jgi:hypothetical protein
LFPPSSVISIEPSFKTSRLTAGPILPVCPRRASSRSGNHRSHPPVSRSEFDPDDLVAGAVCTVPRTVKSNKASPRYSLGNILPS